MGAFLFIFIFSLGDIPAGGGGPGGLGEDQEAMRNSRRPFGDDAATGGQAAEAAVPCAARPSGRLGRTQTGSERHLRRSLGVSTMWVLP